MNAKQKLARFVGMLVVAGSALFPPWQLRVVQSGVETSSSAGYHPLWDPPAAEVELETETEDTSVHYRVAVVRLAVQLGLILLVVNGAVYLLRTRSEPESVE